MRALWRKTFSLLRQYPILWLPVVVAAFASSILNQLVYQLIRRLLVAVSVTHSALSGALIYAPPSYAHTLLIATPLNLAATFITIFFFVASLAATTSILQNPTQTATRMADAVSCIKSTISRLLGFALIVFLVQILTGLMMLPLATPIFRFGDTLQGFQSSLEHKLDLSLTTSIKLETLNLPSFITSQFLLVPYAIVAIWLLAPAAVRILQSRESAPFSGQARMSRIAAATFTAVCVLVSFGLSLALRPIYQLLHPGFLFASALNTATTIINALPLVPLFIALALLARGEQSSPPLPNRTPENPAETLEAAQ